MLCNGGMHTKTISFLGTFFGSSDPTSDQFRTMSLFDEPEDDPFAFQNEEEDRLGLIEQPNDEQEPEWEQLLPSAADEFHFASLFEVHDPPVDIDGQEGHNEIPLPLSTGPEGASHEAERDPVIATWDPYMAVDASEGVQQASSQTPSRKRRLEEVDLGPHPPEVVTPRVKRVRITTKTPPKVVPPVAVIDPNNTTMSDLRCLVKKFSGCEKVRDFFMKVERPKLRSINPSWNSSALTSRLREQWSEMTEDTQRNWLNQNLQSSCGVRVAEPVHRNQDRIDHLKSLAEEDKMMETMTKPELRRCAAMGTWNGKWLENDPEYTRFLANASSNVDIEVQEMLQVLSVQRLISRFEAFLVERCAKLGYNKWSYVFELSMKSEDLGRVHIHAYWHTNKEAETKPFVGTLGAWTFEGSKPFLKPNTTNGKYYQQAVDRGHYYCQCCKIGRLSGHTNYPKYEDYVVQQKWVIQMWQRRKLSHSGARKEVVGARGHTASYMKEIDTIEQLELKVEIEQEKAIIDAMLARAFRPSRFIEEVELWMLQYSRDGPFSIWGVASRFKFLVLTGPSSLGKTQFAKKLFGEHQTLTIGCQNVSTPFLKDYNRKKHKAIIFDEVSSQCIHGNKAIFQANNDVVLLGQTPSAEYVYRVFLYGVAMICCCNDWMEGIDRGSAAEEWLLTNSIVYDCTRRMWQH